MRAQFAGWCGVCDDAIRPGDDIRREREAQADMEVWVHVDCLTGLEEANRAYAVSASRPRCTYCADVLQPDGSCASCGP